MAIKFPLPPLFVMLAVSFINGCTKLLYRILFASAKGSDKILSNNSEFKHFIIPILKNCFSHSVKGTFVMSCCMLSHGSILLLSVRLMRTFGMVKTRIGLLWKWRTTLTSLWVLALLLNYWQACHIVLACMRPRQRFVLCCRKANNGKDSKDKRGCDL